ncbi:MAG: RNA polymerase sigma factor [Proteobacteria bacterium]|nr:RNA polymerase sigma factor [Pseudomonadota bacterium]
MIQQQRDRILPYLQRLFGYAQNLVRDREKARDLVQDAACKALAARQFPRDEAAYRAWLFRILRNQFIDDMRRQGRDNRRLMELDAEAHVAVEYWQGDERLINRLMVRAAIGRVKPGQAEILALIDIAGLSYGEAAEVMNVPVGTIMSRLSRARTALLIELEGEGGQVLELTKRRKRGG